MIQPLSITKVKTFTSSDDGESLSDIHVFPRTSKESLLYSTVKGSIRVKGEPKQINPMDKESGIVGTIGAGNFSGALEVIQAIFWENCVVVYKPHPINAEITNKLWSQVWKPLIDHNALALCDADQGKELAVDQRLSKIYFTGGSHTANAIAKATNTPLISECGGVNPVIVVPGDWTDKEMKHQALYIVSFAKSNGGAACGRGQTIVTSKQWPQREAFLKMIEEATRDDTFAMGGWYPDSEKKVEEFLKAYPNAKVLEPEGGKYKEAKCMFITGDSTDGYACTHEAFSLVMTEVPLDVPATAKDFLPAAVQFSNDKLLGSLDAAILIDETTRKENEEVLSQAVTDLKYGTIGINASPVTAWLSPYLIWGGNETEKSIVESGQGHFGNLLGFENIEKTIIYDSFVSPGHLILHSKYATDVLCDGLATVSVNPSWYQLVKFIVKAIYVSMLSKDF